MGMAEKSSERRRSGIHIHIADHVPQTQIPIPSCEFKTRRNVNVISYAGWMEGGKSPRHHTSRARGGARGQATHTWNLDADCGERWSTEACVRARAFLGGRGGGEISSCDRAWLELGDTTTPKDERD